MRQSGSHTNPIAVSNKKTVMNLFLLPKISLDIDKICVTYSIPALSNNRSIILGHSNLDIAAIGAAVIAYHSFTSKESPENLIVSW